MKSNGTGQFASQATLDEALQLLAGSGVKWRILAGGTDVLAQNEHHLSELNLLDIGALIELREIREDDDSVNIGALASYTDIIGSRALQEWAPALVSAAREVGGVQIQNMGTLGGNLVNASPAADGVPPLFVLDARIVLRSVRGERAVAVGEFASGPGRTIIAPDELLTEIVIPKARRDGEEITFFQKVGPRRAQTIAKASVAFRGWLDSGRLTNVRVALGAVAPTVMFAPRTARVLTDGTLNRESLMRAADVAGGECSPIDDVRSTAAYRRKLVRGLLIRNLWQHIR
ncbi:MAG: xanthine dehydrogenase family protein subunit M [Chloroflexi bacterium]|nr:xanthine dehydrogenase family protein subunit M [Chloroflexota bacterium]